MTATTARVGFGSKVEISTDAEATWTEINEVTALTPPAATVNNPVATHMQSLAVERVPGRIVDYGQTTFSINWVPGSAADVLLRGLVTGAAPFSIRETFPNGVTWKISGLLASMTPATPMEDRMTCDITIDTTGALTVGNAAAPTNVTLPGIAGTVQVGQTLYAFPGVWTGAPAFTYVWKNEGVAIPGATGQTYVLVVGDQGDNITVTVTGTNSAGNASATSAETIAVAAA